MRLAVAQDGRADRDRRVEVAVVAEIADCAAIQAAPLALGRGDELHRPDLRRPGERSGRKDGPERVDRVSTRRHPRLDMRHEMENVAVLLDLHIPGNRDRPGTGDPAEVVPTKV